MSDEIQIPENVTREELDEAVRILKEDISASDVRKLNQRLDDMETKGSERDAKEEERWAKWEAKNADPQTPQTPPQPVGGPGSPPPTPEGGGPNPPPVKKEDEPPVQKPGKKRWYEGGNYSS